MAISSVFCPECGLLRICNPGSPYAVCPNGCGRLVPRYTRAEFRQAVGQKLPEARKQRRGRFAISVDGRVGRYAYYVDGRAPAAPDATVAPGLVLARYEAKSGRRIRVFVAVADPKRKRKKKKKN